jgi:hypothetical protein
MVISNTCTASGVDRSELHDQLVEEFGLPAPTQGKYREIVQCYHWDDGPLFHVYDPKSMSWRVWGAGDSFAGEEITNGRDFSLEELEHYGSMIALLAPPETPSPGTLAAASELFVHAGWLFRWRYLAQGAWRLIPITRC